MILDSLLLFTGASTGIGNSDGKYDVPTTGAQASSNIVDLGITGGIPASAVNGGGARDIGIGDDPAMKFMVQVGAVALSGGTSISVAVQGSADAGSNTPSATWTTYATGPVVTTGAGWASGARLFDVDMPRVAFGAVMPRFIRLLFTSVGTFSGGGEVAGYLVLDRNDQVISSGGYSSGYPAGVTVAN